MGSNTHPSKDNNLFLMLEVNKLIIVLGLGLCWTFIHKCSPQPSLPRSIIVGQSVQDHHVQALLNFDLDNWLQFCISVCLSNQAVLIRLLFNLILYQNYFTLDLFTNSWLFVVQHHKASAKSWPLTMSNSKKSPTSRHRKLKKLADFKCL